MRASRSTAAAFHEAGHVVARTRCDVPLMGAEIYPNGSGLTHGAGGVVRLEGQYQIWDWVTYHLAGVFAERGTGKCLPSLRCGKEDGRTGKLLTPTSPGS